MSKANTLLIGIKRKLHRYQDARAHQADKEFAALRGKALSAGRYQCVYCGFRSKKHIEVHHRDDDHQNNQPENLVSICPMCHAYHHVGEPSKHGSAKGLSEGHFGAQTRLIRVPHAEKIPAQDFNHLLRAIGVAMADPDESKVARQVFSLISNESLRNEMEAALVSNHPADMAAAFSHLTDDEYERRGTVVGAVRMLFSPRLLTQWGRQLSVEYTALSQPSRWETLLGNMVSKVFQSGQPAAAQPSNSKDNAEQGAGLDAGDVASGEGS